jgi:hypothetical protein
MTEFSENRIPSESPPPGSGAVRLDDFLNPPPPSSPERQAFEATVARVKRIRGLSCPEAERAAYEILLVEFLNRTHPDTDPNRCAWCGKPETLDAILLPIGVGIRHAWLHPDCWASWRARRLAEAIDQLGAIGIEAQDPNSQTDSRVRAMEVAAMIEGEYPHRVHTASRGTIAPAESGAAPSFDPHNHPCAVPGCRAYAPFGFGYPHAPQWFCSEHAPRFVPGAAAP